MKNPLLNVGAAVLVALPLVLAVLGPASAQQGCISGREAQQFVEARRILSLDRAANAAGYSPVDIVSQSGPQLCDLDGNPFWRVNVRDGGDYRSVDLPAGI